MKSARIQALCQADVPAPALSRGLAVLAALGDESPLSLDTLSGRLRLPKASVFRLLETLLHAGMISKTTDKRYEALWTLRPLADTREHLRSRINQKMTTLCAATGCTIEWYEPGDEGMKLILQTHPETEVRVLVRPGYIRRWDGEFEAVNRLGYSFFNDAPRPVGLSLHVENGVIKKIPHAQAARMIAECRSSKTASDLAFNRNSVRRHAIAVFHPDESIFHGILAIAEVFRFTAPPSPSTFINRLAEAIASL